MRLVEREQYSVSIQLMMRKKLSLSSLLAISFSEIVALLSSRRSLRSRNVLRMMSASSLASFPLTGKPYNLAMSLIEGLLTVPCDFLLKSKSV